MSASSERVFSTIEKLKESFEGTSYFDEMQLYEDEPKATKNDVILSVIIPARNEFPNIVHTVHAILNTWESDGFKADEIEIIVVNNCSTDYNDPKYEWQKPGDRGTTEHLMPRGIYYSRTLRVLYDPIAGNHSARNKGARIARGKYLFFSDAHMSYRPGTFKHGLQTVEETKGLVHCGIAWMGGYPPHPTSVGMQYTIKLGEEWKGTWATYRPWEADDKGWFYIAAQGHCSLFVDREQFLDFGGYPDIHRTYGGGELYLDMKWWMFGSTVAVEQRAVGYHLSSGRGYVWHHDDYVHNVYNCAYALGCDDWLERAHFSWMRRGRAEVLERMLREAKKEAAEDRRFVESRRTRTFNETLVEKPWDKMNMDKGGACNSSMLIFHYTWLLDLKEKYPLLWEKYQKNETLQKLDKFIVSELGDYIYKRDEYKDKV